MLLVGGTRRKDILTQDTTTLAHTQIHLSGVSTNAVGNLLRTARKQSVFDLIDQSLDLKSALKMETQTACRLDFNQ